jgi:ATP-dependent DNA helicase DinG
MSVEPKDYLKSWNYPKPPRAEQVEILDFISGSKVDTVLVHAPAGVGKSAICASLAQSDTGAVITPHKLLQDQYLRDWPSAKVLKGKVNYECSAALMQSRANSTTHVFGSGTCKAGGMWCREGSCPYKCAKESFLNSKMGVTNYNWLLSSIKGATEVPHDWLLFDEAHELEPKLIDTAAIEITEDFCVKHSAPFELFDSEEDAKEWLLAEVKPALQAAYDKKTMLAETGKSAEVEVELSDLGEVLGSIGFYEMMKDEETWVYSIAPRNNKCSFKPLFAAGLFSRFIAPMKKKHLITSATLSPGKLIKKWLGIDAFDEISVPSPFPVDNRPVYLKGMAYLNRSNLTEKLPLIVKTIDAILEGYPNDKGIIHCQSFALGSAIFKLSNFKNRLLLHDAGNTREQILETHLNSKYPTVLLSPSMTEGVDLADDLSRFTIIPKCPYPNLGDKWVQRRKDEDADWCDWQIAKTIMQGVGRSIRHAEDYADTYILDGVFMRFYENNKSLFPKWFRQSIIIS